MCCMVLGSGRLEVFFKGEAAHAEYIRIPHHGWQSCSCGAQRSKIRAAGGVCQARAEPTWPQGGSGAALAASLYNTGSRQSERGLCPLVIVFAWFQSRGLAAS